MLGPTPRRLARCLLTAGTSLALAAAATPAIADPPHTPGRAQLPSTSNAPLVAPPWTAPHGRKLG